MLNVILTLIFQLIPTLRYYQRCFNVIFTLVIQPNFNQTPISLLLILAKKFEGIVFKNLHYLTLSKLITKNQSGFRPGDSCTNQLLSLVHDIHKVSKFAQSIQRHLTKSGTRDRVIEIEGRFEWKGIKLGCDKSRRTSGLCPRPITFSHLYQ